MQAQWKQYGINHHVTATIYTAKGETLKKIALQIFESMFEI